jgi:NAD(P)-dependent dehydrogenase (short-subunit alcohol dehydrogenase family)
MHAWVAIVTRGESGFGRGIALALAADGYSVVIAGRRSEALTSVAGEALEAGLTVLAVQADVRDQASVRAPFAKTKEAFGRNIREMVQEESGVGDAGDNSYSNADEAP